MHPPREPSRAGAPSLEALAAAARGGDEASFEELARRVRAPLCAFLARRLPESDVDDLAQETLLRAYQKIERYDPARPFVPWLYTIGKRLALNHVDAGRRRRDLATRSTSPGEPAVEMQAPADLWLRARRVLPDEQYRALFCRYVEGYSVREVARELGRSSASTAVLLYRARKRLVLEIEP